MSLCVRCNLTQLLSVARISCPATTQVRWKKREPVRKPKWLPRAPSKLYQVYQPPEYPQDEQEQIDHLDRVFSTKYRSIKQYFHEAFYKPSLSAGGKTTDQVLLEREEDEQLLIENLEENRRVAVIRAQRLERERALLSNDLLETDAIEKEQIEVRESLAKTTIEQELKRFDTYVTKDNIEAAIDEALENPTSYDFAIDVKGNIVSDGPMHPYSRNPSSIPETRSQKEEIAMAAQQPPKFTEKKLY